MQATEAPTSGFVIFSQGGQNRHEPMPVPGVGHGLQVASQAPESNFLNRDDSSGTIKGAQLGSLKDGEEEEEREKDKGTVVVRTPPNGKSGGSSPMDYALTHIGPTATSQALIKYASGSTLLPQNIATMITSLSLLARVSLRSTAFFVEVILEAAKFSTSTSLGLTRRALISAIGSARALHGGMDTEKDWDPADALAITDGKAQSAPASRYAQLKDMAKHETFLSVLDKYTALGIYVIHHTFTMAELFAMSGFYLVDTSIKAGISAADESVRMIDGIFGSNETSRALSSFITLVKREIADSSVGTKMLGLTALASLTKAITAFAVLQNATYKRSAHLHKTKVLYDCTLLGTVDTDSWRSMIVGGGNFVKSAAMPSVIPARGSSSGTVRGNSAQTPSSPAPTLRRHTTSRSADLRSSRSHYGGDTLCLTDIGSDAHYEVDDFDSGTATTAAAAFRAAPSSNIGTPLSSDKDEDIVNDLNYLVGSDGDLDASGPVVRRSYRRNNPETGAFETVYEEVTETTETIEETTISHAHQAAGGKHSRLANPFGPLIPTRGKSRGGQEHQIDAEDWTEIGSDDVAMRSDERDLMEGTIPQAPNGLPVNNVGTIARKQALERPEETKARMQVVLKTITRKLTQKRKVIRTRHEGGQTVTTMDEFETIHGDAFSENTSSDIDSPPHKQRLRALPADESSHRSSDSRPRGATALQNLFGRRKGNGGTWKNSSSSSADRTPPSSPKPPQMSLSPATPEKRLPDIPNASPSMRSRFGFGSAMDSENKTPKRRSRTQSVASLRSFASTRKEVHTTTNAASAEVERLSEGQFPQQHFVKNLHTFMRYSSAAYGQNFMRIFGIGRAEYLFADTSRHHSNVWNFAHHVGVPVDNVLLSSFTEGETAFHSDKMAPLVNYIAVDDANKAIVFTCRGTLGLSDILTDLTCDYEPIPVKGGNAGDSFLVHSGMLASAIRLKDESKTVHSTLKQALEQYPDYGLVLTGHSLGGGVAALLAILWSIPIDVYRQEAAMLSDTTSHPPFVTRFVTSLSSGLPPGRPIHAYAYGVPAIGSADLSRYCKGLVTSLVHGHDLVPSLSLGALRDMRNVAETLGHESESTVAQEIVGAVVGLYQSKRKDAAAAGFRCVPKSCSCCSPTGDANNFPRPSEPPAHEREVKVDANELMRGKTKNRAMDAGYMDPVLKEDALSPPAAVNGSSGTGTLTQQTDGETRDWLWSLIKTMRASMGEEKLYPPGDVFSIEAFEVYVTPRTSQQHQQQQQGGGGKQQEEHSTTSRSEAHRVILRECPDVEKRFSEPIFARSMLRDHIPTNYELCTELLYESVLGDSGNAAN